MTNDNEATSRRVASVVPLRACPICRKPAQLAYRPFCSKRCSDIDLSRWLNGVYAVPARDTDQDEDEER